MVGGLTNWTITSTVGLEFAFRSGAIFEPAKATPAKAKRTVSLIRHISLDPARDNVDAGIRGNIFASGARAVPPGV
ncbi:MAG: hypothetical protein DMG58_20320 [Acidobacteria bacterium]|nr:MAG: hypothetical protein DMG58_20320 [Acidobacteriota bacterium]